MWLQCEESNGNTEENDCPLINQTVDCDTTVLRFNFRLQGLNLQDQVSFTLKIRKMAHE